MRVWPGNPYPLGATWDGKGVNFALFSEHATRVELCLFDTVDAGSSRSVFPCLNTPIRSGMPICLRSSLASSMATASMALMSHSKAIALIQQNGSRSLCQVDWP